MAAEEDELVSRYAHDLVTRVLKTSMKQLEGSVQWPSSATFTAAVGRDTIEQLVSSWQLDKSWRYSLDYLGLKDELHCYRLLWSRPTRRNPVPRVAAAVYIFILMTEETSPVTAFYIVEGQTLVHQSSQPLKEVWLNSAIENKQKCTEVYIA